MGKFKIMPFFVALAILTTMFFVFPSYKPVHDYKNITTKGGSLRFETVRFVGTFINQGADYVLKLEIGDTAIFEKLTYITKSAKTNVSLTLYNQHQHFVLHFVKGRLSGVTQTINHNPDLGLQGGTIYYEQQWN
jgi:hypothetical protein